MKRLDKLVAVADASQQSHKAPPREERSPGAWTRTQEVPAMRKTTLILSAIAALVLPSTAAAHQRHHAHRSTAPQHVLRHHRAHKADLEEAENASVEAVWMEECGPLFGQLGAEGKQECVEAAEYGLPW